MTVKKIWLMLLMFIAVISVSVNAFVLSALTNRYFRSYITDNYRTHFDRITVYAKKALLEKDLSYSQMAMEMETHLIDPIIRIKLYDVKGNVLIDVSVGDDMMDNGMNGMMRSHYKASEREAEYAAITENGKVIGQLSITRYSSIADSVVSRMFRSSLVTNSLYSIILVLFIALLLGIFVSRKMSKELIGTAGMAQNIDLGLEDMQTKTRIREIGVIRQSLEALKTRIKLKNKSRKVLIDELVHQTRTPLTILKVHLEGIADKIIEMTPEEIKICEDQIGNITAIISDMSRMIDADNGSADVHIEEFEISAVLKQIINGLKAQFDQKKIKIHLETKKKVAMKTDRYIFSQSVYNILTNAYKYTKENGHVNIVYEKENNSVTVKIEDNGEGISEKDIGRIFDAYYRGDTGSINEGEGLGLYFVRENLSKIHGEIKAASKTGCGSTFTITFPADETAV